MTSRLWGLTVPCYITDLHLQEENTVASLETRVIDCIKSQLTEMLAQVKPDAAAATLHLPPPPALTPAVVNETAMLVDDDRDDMQGVVCGGPSQVSAPSPSLAQSQDPSADSAPAPRVVRTLKLANDLTIRYTDQDVKDPSTLTFVEDIPGLNRMWDDTSEFWDGISELTIQGHPIPLMYWGDAYKYSGDSRWKGLKSKVHGWKVSCATSRECAALFFSDISSPTDCCHALPQGHRRGLLG